jgi:hypothetical protein
MTLIRKEQIADIEKRQGYHERRRDTESNPRSGKAKPGKFLPLIDTEDADQENGAGHRKIWTSRDSSIDELETGKKQTACCGAGGRRFKCSEIAGESACDPQSYG